MKRVILFAVAVLIVCAAKAQFSAGDFIYGGKVGLNVTNISNMGVKAKASIHIGAFAEWKMNDFIGISPEFVYSRQGAADKTGGVKTKVRVNYLNIPILAKLYVLENLSVDLGPQLGFALNGKSVAKAEGVTVKDKMEDLNTIYNRQNKLCTLLKTKCTQFSQTASYNSPVLRRTNVLYPCGTGRIFNQNNSII